MSTYPAFLITSHGWSASHWLAYSLNQHPDIACLHSSAALLADDIEAYTFKGMEHPEALAEIYPTLWQIRAGYERRLQVSPEQLFTQFRPQTRKSHIAAVHTFRLRDLLHLDPPTVPGLKVANLIRHPVDLVNSGLGQFRLSFKLDLNDLFWALKKLVDSGLPEIEQISIQHQEFPGDFENLCFLAACQSLLGIQQDFAAAKVLQQQNHYHYLGLILKEQITTDPMLMQSWIDRLSDKQLAITQEYLDGVYTSGKINPHNEAYTSTNSHAIYSSWSPWQQHIFNYYFDLYDLYADYHQAGYDLSMLENPIARDKPRS